MSKCIFFSPYSEIWAHAYPESKVIEALVQKKWEVETVRCNGLLNEYCTPMNVHRLDYLSTAKDKKRVCESCIKKRNLLSSISNSSTSVIEDYLDKDELDFVNSYFQKNDFTDLEDLEFFGVQIGKFAAYEFLINNKIEYNSKEMIKWPEIQHEVKKSMFCLIAMRKMMEKFSPNYLVVYNSLYSINRALCVFFESNGIPAYSIHAGSYLERKYSQIQLYRWNLDPQLIHKSLNWKNNKLKTLSYDQIKSVEDQVDNIIKAKNVFTYSSELSGRNIKDIRKIIGLNGNPTALAVLSSVDEYEASVLVGLFEEKKPPYIFKDTLDWLVHLIDFFRRNTNLNLIIRVHPREFPNKRENVKSAHNQKILEVLKSIPNNIHVNLPTDNFSIYEMFLLSDIVLNQNSSTGLEASVFGIPTLVHDPKYFIPYDVDVGEKAITKEEYFNKLQTLINSSRKIEYSIKAYRYIYYSTIFSSINIEGASYYRSNPIGGFKYKIFNYFIDILKNAYLKLNLTFYEKYIIYKNFTPLENIDEIIDTLIHGHDYVVENCLKVNNYKIIQDLSERQNIRSSLTRLEKKIKQGD
jgi:hypothetical protein